MKFFSGFSLQGEEVFFKPFIKESAYTVCGFSYGAIKAYEHAKAQIAKGKRVDTLQLFSPAFFQTKSEKFKKLQLLGYQKNEELYLQNFLVACFAPHPQKSVSLACGTSQELQELLFYKWNLDALAELRERGVVIEVYLGMDDAIIDAPGAREFFVEVATVTAMKNANHFLLRG
ncbi:MAG: pimelyl-ACP methyl ester esterase BioV [Sulfurimonadaceae bacterium]|jgi:hypothetical protein